MSANAVRSSELRDVKYSSSVMGPKFIPVDIKVQREKLTFGKFTYGLSADYNPRRIQRCGQQVTKGIYMQNDLFDKRQKRLLQLLQTRFDGSQTKLAEAVGRTSAYISFLLADKDLPHHKNLGEKLARHIETAVGLAAGWLDGDQEAQIGRRVQPFKDNRQPPTGFVLIKRKAVNLSAGNGEILFDEETAPPLAFRQEWLDKENLQADKLVIAYAKGDSMTPRIHDGDTLMIDTDQNALRDGGIFALRVGDELRVKRVYRRTMSVILHSDNEKYPEEELSLEQAEHLHVIGRVVWVSGNI